MVAPSVFLLLKLSSNKYNSILTSTVPWKERLKRRWLPRSPCSCPRYVVAWTRGTSRGLDEPPGNWRRSLCIRRNGIVIIHCFSLASFRISAWWLPFYIVKASSLTHHLIKFRSSYYLNSWIHSIHSDIQFNTSFNSLLKFIVETSVSLLERVNFEKYSKMF